MSFRLKLMTCRLKLVSLRHTLHSSRNKSNVPKRTYAFWSQRKLQSLRAPKIPKLKQLNWRNKLS